MELPAWSRILLASVYLIIISILFCLPGSALPKADWLSKVYFDKWVHIGFFLALTVLWLWAFQLFKKPIVYVLIGAALYGLAVEIVQDQFIVNRSFDVGDWIADVTGSVAGLWVWKRYIKK